MPLPFSFRFFREYLLPDYSNDRPFLPIHWYCVVSRQLYLMDGRLSTEDWGIQKTVIVSSGFIASILVLIASITFDSIMLDALKKDVND